MDLSTLAAAFLTAWFLLAPPHGDLAYRPNDQLPPIEQPKSGRFRMEGSVGAGVVQGTVRGSGMFAEPDRVQVALDTSAGGRSERFEIIVIGRTTYVRGSSAPNWQVIDLPSDTPLGQSPRSGEQVSPEAERAVNEVLGSFQLVGLETLAGAQTERYHGELDFLSLAESLTPGDRTVRDAFKTLRMMMDYWIGREDRYLHQMKLALEGTVRQPTPGQPDTVTADLTIALSDFNQPITISAPVGQATPPPTPIPTPVQPPAQLPARAPARLPNTGSAPVLLLPIVAGLALVLVGRGLRRRTRVSMPPQITQTH